MNIDHTCLVKYALDGYIHDLKAAVALLLKEYNSRKTETKKEAKVTTKDKATINDLLELCPEEHMIELRKKFDGAKIGSVERWKIAKEALDLTVNEETGKWRIVLASKLLNVSFQTLYSLARKNK